MSLYYTPSFEPQQTNPFHQSWPSDAASVSICSGLHDSLAARMWTAVQRSPDVFYLDVRATRNPGRHASGFPDDRRDQQAQPTEEVDMGQMRVDQRARMKEAVMQRCLRFALATVA